MRLSGWIAAGALAFAAMGARAQPARKPLVDPFPLRFPLAEAGSLEIEGHIAGQPRVQGGIVYFTTREGHLTAVVASSRSVLSRSSASPADPGRPAQAGDLVLRTDADTLRAIDGRGQTAWEFKAEGAIAADPVRAGRRIYFGDSERMFYCLDAATGKVRWRRRLQGAPVQPAVVAGGRVAVAASNSVVYRLSATGGSILSWQAVPSRVIYELAAAGPIVLISSASPTVTALDMRTGKTAGQYEASGSPVAGAVWSPPYVVLFVEDEASGRQKLVFLRSR